MYEVTKRDGARGLAETATGCVLESPAGRNVPDELMPLLRPSGAVLVALALVFAVGCNQGVRDETRRYAYDMSWWFPRLSGAYPAYQDDLDELLAIEPPPHLAAAHRALYEAAAERVRARQAVAYFEKQSYDRWWDEVLEGKFTDAFIQTCGNRPFVRLPHEFERTCMQWDVAESAYEQAERRWTQAMAEACGVPRIRPGFVAVDCYLSPDLP